MQAHVGSDTNWLRLRQIALLAPSLEPLERQFGEILGLGVCHRDPAVAKFGLENVLFPIGHQFLEIVAPTTQDSAGARQLARQGGAGGYMVITQCREHAAYRARAAALGLRVVHAFEEPDFLNMQLHPRDTGGTFFEIDEQRGPRAHAPNGPWAPAGTDWERTPPARATAITAAEIACAAPADVASRWAALTACACRSHGGSSTLTLDNAELRFVPLSDTRADHLAGIDITVNDPAPILAAGARHGVVTGNRQLTIAGLRITLV